MKETRFCQRKVVMFVLRGGGVRVSKFNGDYEYLPLSDLHSILGAAKYCHFRRITHLQKEYLCTSLSTHLKIHLLRSNIMKPQRLWVNNATSLYTSNLRKDRPTVIYVHGFTEQVNGRGSTTMKNAYLKKGSFNVILVDWSPLCAFPWYAHAVLNTHAVGLYLSKFVKFIVSHGVPIKSIHLIGFSLGAEIAGFTGKDTTFGKLARITGLDPAFPLYMFSGERGHLAPTDADFVDVIHTDGGVFGFPIALGDADFFPNGGYPAQPGCRINSLLQKDQIQRIVSCSHDRAWQYYAESVLNERGFPATRCPTYSLFLEGRCPPWIFLSKTNRTEIQYMGYAANPKLKGRFFLVTNSREPFATNYQRRS